MTQNRFFLFLPAVILLLMPAGALAQKAATANKTVKTIIRTDQAPQPVGPYSQGVMANGFLFLAGQTGVDPQTRVLVQESMEAEARQVMENLRAVLQAAGMDFRHVVKTTVFLTDINDFGLVNKVYGSFFPADPPARETVQVAKLPGNARIEISMVAVQEKGEKERSKKHFALCGQFALVRTG